MNLTLEQWDTALDSQGKAFLVGVREASQLMPNAGRILDYLRSRCALWKLAALGGYGISESSDGISVSILRGCSRTAAYHRERN